MIIPVILAGGSGTRLWPMSRQHYPKQLLKLFGDKTMLQQTISRLNGVANLAAPIVVCNEEHRFMVAEQLHEIGQAKSSIILEPVARNTAPALALAAIHARTLAENPILLVLSADHMIKDVNAFHIALADAIEAAQEGHLATFGVTPTRPETGYGYIKTKRDSSLPVATFYPVAQFVEKPDLTTAERYLAEGCYYWNSGMFVFQTEVFLRELQVHSPDVVVAAEQAKVWAVQDLDFIQIGRAHV